MLDESRNENVIKKNKQEYIVLLFYMFNVVFFLYLLSFVFRCLSFIASLASSLYSLKDSPSFIFVRRAGQHTDTTRSDDNLGLESVMENKWLETEMMITAKTKPKVSELMDDEDVE
jgi:hypothetical protein